jgi:WD40 repeat protein
VCNIFWNSDYHELFTTHGFSGPQLAIWKEDGLELVKEIRSFNERVLYAAQSPNGSSIAALSPADSLLQVWQVWPLRAPRVVDRWMMAVR